MREKLPVYIFSFLIFLFIFISFPINESYAQNNVNIKASVGKYNFSASGLVSPYASVVMTMSSIFMSSTVADKDGNFVLPHALVSEGFTDYCLEAVDIRRIGSSYTCFKTEPLHSDFVDTDLFLPPTVGLSGRKITASSSIFSSGYSMPEASVKLNLGNGIYLDTNTDVNGYYKVEIKDIPKGTYELYATAKYESKNSEVPSRKFKIEAVGLVSSIPRPLLIILLLLPVMVVFILLIILWKRRRNGGEKSSKFRVSSFLRALLKR